MNIIRRRLAKALQLHGAQSQYAQKRNPDRKRKAMSPRGERLLTKHLSIMVSEEQLAALDKVCDRFVVQRGVVIRDALDFYIGMANQEIDEAGALRGIDAVPIMLAPGKIRRPDGVVVTLHDIEPTGNEKTF